MSVSGQKKRERASAIIAGAGFIGAVMPRIARLVFERGGTEEDVYRLAQENPEGNALAERVADLIVASRAAGRSAPAIADDSARTATLFNAIEDVVVPIFDHEFAIEGGWFSHLVETMRKWRAMARAWDVDDTIPVAYLVRAGFRFLDDGPRLGHCYSLFSHDRMRNDSPTDLRIVFWIPWLVLETLGKGVAAQMKVLGSYRTRFMLPESHLTNFGSGALISALIFAHAKRTNERVPLDDLWTWTDTYNAYGNRVFLGHFDEQGLQRGGREGVEESGSDFLGCFAVGVEELELSVT